MDNQYPPGDVLAAQEHKQNGKTNKEIAKALDIPIEEVPLYLAQASQLNKDIDKTANLIAGLIGKYRKKK